MKFYEIFTVFLHILTFLLFGITNITNAGPAKIADNGLDVCENAILR